MKKKTNLIRTGAFTAVLAIGTSCFVSGTLAKYVTSGGGADSARVAKFGVTVTANGTTFAKTYKTHDANYAEANSVISSDDSNVVAPGTNGNMVSMALAGTPEVAVRVSYNATLDVSDSWVDASGAFYCPIVITVGTTAIDGADYTTAADFEAAVKTAIDGYTAQYAPNTNLSAETVAVPAVSWAWPFSTSDANDVKDTFLGDQAAAGNAATILLSVNTTVTQID